MSATITWKRDTLQLQPESPPDTVSVLLAPAEQLPAISSYCL